MGQYDFELELNTKNTMSVIISWIKDGSAVLEFGSANGRLTKYLSQKKNCKVTIVEIDENAGNEAAQYAEQFYVGTFRGNIDHLYWWNPEQKYDYIVFADVLEHLYDPSKILQKCKDMLKKQGEILVSIPNLAHNSILIELFNDRFPYGKTGLLDRTHIHFFTYYSFLETLKKAELYIKKQDVIYSNVGWNEIENSYEDVPSVIEKELRKRTTGSIYQFVYSIICDMPTDTNMPGFQDLPPYTEAMQEIKEISCFYKNHVTEEEFKRLGNLYPCEKTNICTFEINDFVTELRLDPIECSSLIQIENIRIKEKEQDFECVSVIHHNAKYAVGNLYFFETSDPQLQIDIPGNNMPIFLELVEITFRIVDYQMDCERLENYSLLLNPEIICKHENQTFNLYKEESTSYIAHLEKDLGEQKKYIQHLERDLGTQKEYIQHLERDLGAQKEYIQHLEKDLGEQKEYIQHLKKE